MKKMAGRKRNQKRRSINSRFCFDLMPQCLQGGWGTGFCSLDATEYEGEFKNGPPIQVKLSSTQIICIELKCYLFLVCVQKSLPLQRFKGKGMSSDGKNLETYYFKKMKVGKFRETAPPLGAIVY